VELDEAIAQFKTELAGVRAQGKATVDIQALEQYLDTLKSEASISAELRRQNHERELAHYNAVNSHSIENFRVVLAAGKEAINAAIIINGGAVIAVMSFMGATAGKQGFNYLMLFAHPLFLFGTGVLLGGVSFGSRYISQFCYSYPDKPSVKKCGHFANGASWFFTADSFLAFAIGVWESYSGLLTT
jgi:hypothetical protein